jgi:hypothetical protein
VPQPQRGDIAESAECREHTIPPRWGLRNDSSAIQGPGTRVPGYTIGVPSGTRRRRRPCPQFPFRFASSRLGVIILLWQEYNLTQRRKDAKFARLTPMTPDIQQEALALLAEIWALSPDVRLGQLLAHLGFLGEAHIGRGLGDIEDDELMAILKLHKTELLARFVSGSQGDELITHAPHAK